MGLVRSRIFIITQNIFQTTNYYSAWYLIPWIGPWPQTSVVSRPISGPCPVSVSYSSFSLLVFTITTYAPWHASISRISSGSPPLCIPFVSPMSRPTALEEGRVGLYQDYPWWWRDPEGRRGELPGLEVARLRDEGLIWSDREADRGGRC